MSIDPFARSRSDKPQMVSQVFNPQTQATTVQAGQQETLSASQGSIDQVGRDYGDFRTERMLGAGGMGVVYLAQHRESGQLVALKVLRQSMSHHQALTQRFRRESQAIAALAAEIASALQAAHDVGIVHRDVKPSNILLDTHGKAWLTDFGLASFSDDQTLLTMTGEIVGTPTYMSPEHARTSVATTTVCVRHIGCL